MQYGERATTGRCVEFFPPAVHHEVSLEFNSLGEFCASDAWIWTHYYKFAESGRGKIIIRRDADDQNFGRIYKACTAEL